MKASGHETLGIGYGMGYGMGVQDRVPKLCLRGRTEQG